MFQYVSSINNLTVYFDTVINNYKVHDGFKVIANPSTLEDAYRALRRLSGKAEFVDVKNCWKECEARSCDGCERFVW